MCIRQYCHITEGYPELFSFFMLSPSWLEVFYIYVYTNFFSFSKRIWYMLFSSLIRLSSKEIAIQQSNSFTRSGNKSSSLLRRSKWNPGLKVLVLTTCLRGVENTLNGMFGRGTHPEPGNMASQSATTRAIILEVQTCQGSDNVPLKYNNLLQKWPAIMWLVPTLKGL